MIRRIRRLRSRLRRWKRLGRPVGRRQWVKAAGCHVLRGRYRTLAKGTHCLRDDLSGAAIARYAVHGRPPIFTVSFAGRHAAFLAGSADDMHLAATYHHLQLKRVYHRSLKRVEAILEKGVIIDD